VRGAAAPESRQLRPRLPRAFHQPSNCSNDTRSIQSGRSCARNVKGRPRGVTKQENTDRVHEGPGFACGERCALRAGLPVSQDLDRRAIILFRQLSYQLHRERLGVSFSLDWKGHWKCLGFSLLLGVAASQTSFVIRERDPVARTFV